MESGTPTKKLIARISLRTAVAVLLIVFAFTLLPRLLSLFLPFIFSYIVTAFFIVPVLKRLPKKAGGGTKKVLSVVFVVLMTLVIAGIAAVLVYFLISEIGDLIGNWMVLRDTVADSLGKLSALIEKISGGETGGIAQSIRKWLDSLVDSVLAYVPTALIGVGSFLPGVGSFLLGALFAVIGTYFISADYQNIGDSLSSAVPKQIVPHIEQIKKAAGGAVFGYLRAQLILSGMIGFVSFIVLLISGVRFSVLIGLLIGIVDFVPLLGNGLITIPWAVICLLEGNYRLAVILLVMSFGLFMLRKIFEPKIVGDQTGLHPLVSLICIYIGMRLWGVAGMILTPVVVMAFVSLWKMGFFRPAVNDIKELSGRLAAWLKDERN